MNPTKQKLTRFPGLAAGLMAALLAGTAGAQTLVVSSFQGSINSVPPVFGPGDTATAVVTLQGGSFPLSKAWVVAAIPIGVNPVSSVIDAADLQGTFTIGSNVPFGSYQLTAYATDTNGTVYQSAPVPFLVEAYANSYQIQPTAISLRYVGDQSWLRVFGTLPSGSTVDMTYATTTALIPFSGFFAPIGYYSLNQKVAVVDNYGTVTATGPGVTCVGVVALQYIAPALADYPGELGYVTMLIQVAVPTTIRGDLNGDGRVDELDLQILEERLNSPAIKSANLGANPVSVADARDLNGDGQINALDARILVTLCTQSGCAVK